MSTSVSVEGRELIAAWSAIDRGIAAWVLRLADFDRSGVWAEDGFASCVSWLSAQCDIGYSTAKEKLKVAHELTRRHALRAAFEEGLPYSKARCLVRLDGLDEQRDEQFVEHAASDTVRVLEERVKTWNYYAGQDKPPPNIDDHYGIRRERGFGGGMGRLVVEAPDEMLDRVMAVIEAYGEFLRHNGEELETLGTSALPEDELVDKAAVQPYPQAEGDQILRPRAAKRLDWFLDLIEEIQLAKPDKIDPYVAVVGVTVQYEDLIEGTGTALTGQGSTLTGEAVRKLCRDAGIHRIVVKGASEILDFGREQRLFNRTVRRAIRFRHGHTCATRGCGRRITHIHHIQHFENGGETSVDNGIPLCSYHHHLIHDRRWEIRWDAAAGHVQFTGPHGQLLQSEAVFQRAA